MDYGHVTAEVVNIYLRNKGLLDGVPGNWSLTEKGNEYGEGDYYDNGVRPAGSSYNVSYMVPRWNDTIMDDLDINHDDIEKARQEVAELRQQKRTEREENVIDCSLDGSESVNSAKKAMNRATAERTIAVAGVAAAFAAFVYTNSDKIKLFLMKHVSIPWDKWIKERKMNKKDYKTEI